MKTYFYAKILILLPSVSIGFVPRENSQMVWSTTSLLKNQRVRISNLRSGADENNDSDDNDAELLLSASDVNAQMAKLRSKYPTSEADYLAAARQRNVAKQASSEGTASDADWRQIAAEKKEAVGEIDDWESSKSEAGNSDSQILIPLTSSIGEDGSEEEPKLMLF